MKQLFQDENFLLKGGAQIVILSTLSLIIVARGPQVMLRPLDLLALLVFNALVWYRRPIAGDRRWLGVHVYLGLQGLIVCWLYSRNVYWGFLLFILYVQAILLARERGRLVWIVLFLSVLAAGNFYLHSEPDVQMTPVLRLWVFGSFLVFVTLMIINQLRAKSKGEEVEQLLVELSHSNRRLQEYAEKVETLTLVEERSRISRELHDAIGHRLTASIVQIEGARHLIGEYKTQQATRMLGNVHEQLHEGLHELRDTLSALRSPKATENSLIHMLQQLADEFTLPAHGKVHTSLPDAPLPSLSGIQSMTIFRAAQEALTNTAKHAQAQNVWIALDSRTDRLILTVRNDGRDFSPLHGSAGYGLRGMRERAAQLGGTLMVIKPEEGGTLVTLALPLHTERERDMPAACPVSDLEEIAAMHGKGNGAKHV